MMADLIVSGGHIEAGAGQVVDAIGDLLSARFVDLQVHMDPVLSYGLLRVNASGTLLKGIGLWGALRATATVDERVARALRYCDLAVSMEVLAVKSHVHPRLDHLRGVAAMAR